MMFVQLTTWQAFLIESDILVVFKIELNHYLMIYLRASEEKEEEDERMRKAGGQVN